MSVYFIGAGPGAPDLITVRGQKLIQSCMTCLYAGSLVPKEIVEQAPKTALVMDTAPMHLQEIVEQMLAATERGEDVARVHSGDPSIYGAIGEQMQALKLANIPFEIIPGVPAFAAAAAKIGAELTLPNIAQTIIITRTQGKASDMPKGEELAILAQSGATLAIHLSIRNLSHIKQELTPFYGSDCPVVIAYRATWPDEKFIHTNLDEMAKKVREQKITRTALIFVGRVFEEQKITPSSLYDSDFAHILRNQGKKRDRVPDPGS